MKVTIRAILPAARRDARRPPATRGRAAARRRARALRALLRAEPARAAARRLSFWLPVHVPRRRPAATRACSRSGRAELEATSGRRPRRRAARARRREPRRRGAARVRGAACSAGRTARRELPVSVRSAGRRARGLARAARPCPLLAHQPARARVRRARRASRSGAHAASRRRACSSCSRSATASTGRTSPAARPRRRWRRSPPSRSVPMLAAPFALRAVLTFPVETASSEPRRALVALRLRRGRPRPGVVGVRRAAVRGMGHPDHRGRELSLGRARGSCS